MIFYTLDEECIDVWHIHLSSRVHRKSAWQEGESNITQTLDTLSKAMNAAMDEYRRIVAAAISRHEISISNQ